MDPDRLVEWLIALGAGAVVLEIVRSLFMRKKMGADYADVISAAAVRLLAPLETRITELEEEVNTYKQELHEAVLEAERWKAAAKRERERFEDKNIPPHPHYPL